MCDSDRMTPHDPVTAARRQAISVSVATGLYGVSFGALSVAAGLDVAQTMALSLLMFSGGSQFAFIGVVGGGGAAGLNSVRIARRLGCRTLIIPETGPALSAAGALMSELKAEYHAALVAHTDNFDNAAVNATLAGLAEKAQRFAEGPGAGALETRITFKADARYATEVWEIEVPLRGGAIADAEQLAAFVEDFHHTHEMLFSFRDEGSFIEVVGWTAEVTCRLAEAKELRLATPRSLDARSSRPAWFAGVGWSEVPVHRFETLEPRRRLAGPAIVENDYTTVIVDPGASAERRPSGSLVIDIG